MLSTTVSIAGKVQRIFSDGTPTSNGVYRFGSNVSGAAMPPAIQSRMHVSAVGFGMLDRLGAADGRGSPEAERGHGGGAHGAEEVAAAVATVLNVSCRHGKHLTTSTGDG